MTTNIRAIETVYNGYRFRSRLEARWAVFFDALGIPYEYEKEGYDLGKLGWYLPDFWLPSLDAWCEIKGDEPTKDEQLKLAKLTENNPGKVGFIRHKTPDPVANLGYAYWIGKFIGWHAFVQCIDCGAVGFISQFQEGDPVSAEWKKQVFQRLRCKPNCLHELGFTTDTPAIHAAFTAARLARFEHGESPSVRIVTTSEDDTAVDRLLLRWRLEQYGGWDAIPEPSRDLLERVLMLNDGDEDKALYVLLNIPL